MIIFCPNLIYFLCLYLEKYEKSGFTEQSILHKNLESAELTNKKHGKPTLHSLIANHVLQMSVKLKFQCVRFERNHCFALVVLNMFPFLFLLRPVHTMRLGSYDSFVLLC